MDESDVVRIVRTYIEGQFPKRCARCGRHFQSLREYLQSTAHLGQPVSYGHVIPDLGPLSLANCTCGNTLAIGSEGLPPETLRELQGWARVEMVTRGVSIGVLLHHVRERIDAEVLA